MYINVRVAETAAVYIEKDAQFFAHACVYFIYTWPHVKAHSQAKVEVDELLKEDVLPAYNT